jgi:hypothetical protein
MQSYLARCQTLIESATAGLEDASAASRVDGRWSIAEIVEHLDRTYTGTSKGLMRCLESGTPRVTVGTLGTRARRFWVVTLGRFPTGIPAPRHVVPSGELLLSALVTRTAAHLADMDVALAQAAGRFGAGPVMDHPILGPFTVRHWARFHYVHTRHHCHQIAARRQAVAAS